MSGLVSKVSGTPFTRINATLIPHFCRKIKSQYAILKAKKGDSGGPLIQTALVEGTPIEWLVGVVSFGVGCARPGLGGAYSSIEHYSQWIADTVNHFKANHQ